MSVKLDIDISGFLIHDNTLLFVLHEYDIILYQMNKPIQFSFIMQYNIIANFKMRIFKLEVGS